MVLKISLSPLLDVPIFELLQHFPLQIPFQYVKYNYTYISTVMAIYKCAKYRWYAYTYVSLHSIG